MNKLIQVVQTIDGISPADLGMMTLRESARPILPPTVDRITELALRHGAIDFGADMGPRQITLAGAFAEQDAYGLQARIEQLANFLLDRYGRPRDMPLTFVSNPYRQIVVRYSGSLDIDRVVGIGTFSLPFAAFDPFFYSAVDNINEQTLTASGAVIAVQSAGNVQTNGEIRIRNVGSTTLNRFTISNEYELD